MGLVKCPDCEKMVSERVSACPNCGCPAEFFTNGNSLNNNKGENKTTTNNINNTIAGSSNDKYKIVFCFSDKQHIQYDIRDKELAKYCGSLYREAMDSRFRFEQLYRNSYNMDIAIKKLGDEAGVIIGKIMDKCVRFLFVNNINYTPIAFFEKYSKTKKLAYYDFIDDVLNQYAEIYDEKKQLADYRNSVIAGRSRWMGGGFGLKGAIKGAITAGAMNIGTDFLHSF